MISCSQSIPMHELDTLRRFQKLASGVRFGMSRVESTYLGLEKDLMSRSKSAVVEQLKKSLSSISVKRFLDTHNNYAHFLINLKHSKWVIKHDNQWKLFFDFITNLAILYTVIVALYSLSFDREDKSVAVPEIIAYFVFFIDFTLNFFTEYIDEKGQSIRNLKLITLRYLSTWLLLDLLALIPLKPFGFTEPEYFFHLSRVMKVDRIFYTFRIRNLTKYLKENFGGVSVQRQRLFFIMEYSTELFFEICKFVFICYFFACTWVGFVIRLDENNVTGDNFMKHYGLELMDKNEQVIICIYFIFTTLTTVGYGDYSATNSYEMGLCMLIMFIGSAWLALTLSKVMSFVTAFEKIGKSKNNLSDLTVFLHNLESIHGPMPRLLKARLFNHFSYYWKHDRLGSLMNSTYTSPSKLCEIQDSTLRNLPSKLKSSILDYLFRDYFLTFFKFFGKDDEFRYDVCLYFQPRYHNEEFILFVEERATELLFIKKGAVVVGFLGEDDLFVSCFKLFPGVIIGESSVFIDENSLADFKAERVEGLALPERVVLGVMGMKYQERLKEYRKIVRLRASAVKKVLQESPQFKCRCVRTQMQARLSSVFQRSAIDKGKVTLQDLYSEMKKYKRLFEKISREVKQVVNRYEDN